MPAVKVDSQSTKVRRYVRAILARDTARLTLDAAEAQVKVHLAALTGSRGSGPHAEAG